MAEKEWFVTRFNNTIFNKLPQHYIALWVLVSMVTFMVVISFVIYGVGYGRWECSEYQQKTTITCDTKCEKITEQICTKEVWTRKNAINNKD